MPVGYFHIVFTLPAEIGAVFGSTVENADLPTARELSLFNSRNVSTSHKETRVRIDGPLVLNTIDLIRDAVLDRHGLACLPLDQVQNHLDESRLMRVPSRFTPDMPGYHLYYPHRRHASSTFKLLAETLRHPAP